MDRITHRDPRRESWALLQELHGLTGKEYRLKEVCHGLGFVVLREGVPFGPQQFKKDMPNYLLGVIHGFVENMRE